MMILIFGLIIFLGSHSIRIFAESWRTQMISQLGEKKFKGVYTLISLLGFALIIVGYSQVRQNPIILWQPNAIAMYFALFLNLIAFILLAGSARSNNAIRLKLKHPMILGVKVWALAHLLANGTLVDAILFGSFLIWAVLDFRSARNRPVPFAQNPEVSNKATIITVISGLILWVIFILGVHQWLIGVSPLAGLG